MIEPAGATTHTVRVGEKTRSNFVHTDAERGYTLSVVGPGQLRLEFYLHSPAAPAPTLDEAVVGVLLDDQLLATLSEQVSYGNVIESPAFGGIRVSTPLSYTLEVPAGVHRVQATLPAEATLGLSTHAEFVDEAIEEVVYTQAESPPPPPAQRSGASLGVALGGGLRFDLGQPTGALSIEGDYGFALGTLRLSIALRLRAAYHALRVQAPNQASVARVDTLDPQSSSRPAFEYSDR